MTDTNGVARVVSVLEDQVPKLNKACDEVAAMAQASVLRAINEMGNIAGDFKRLDEMVTKLQQMRAAATNGPPAAETYPEIKMPEEVNPNGPLAPGPTLVR